jgi:hypothetical protein
MQIRTAHANSPVQAQRSSSVHVRFHGADDDLEGAARLTDRLTRRRFASTLDIPALGWMPLIKSVNH